MIDSIFFKQDITTIYPYDGEPINITDSDFEVTASIKGKLIKKYYNLSTM